MYADDMGLVAQAESFEKIWGDIQRKSVHCSKTFQIVTPNTQH